ncbi:hypothetical protein COLO4_15575 [Corchorus olitorius]|uniref:Uncharacterized protein n=1 Tax=Corchorus olitorius TaxID=93759 RepID=A0A1R3JMA5_9ROSI|nr:hypothetical protein COLO4_15575 [Corchorus olitorius]
MEREQVDIDHQVICTIQFNANDVDPRKRHETASP